MYSIVFTSVLVLILIWKTNKLFKNKRNSGDLEGVNDELIIMLNEGEST
jgi:hypothetical protein